MCSSCLCSCRCAFTEANSDSQVIARSRILLKQETFKCNCPQIDAMDSLMPSHKECNCKSTAYNAGLEVALCLLLMCRFHPYH